VVEAGERFLTAVDDPPGAARLDDALAACAGVVAELQELSAKAGLGSGDLVVWIGDDPRMALGARLSRARGCPTFTLGAAAEAPLRLGDGPAAWGEALAGAARLGAGRLPRAPAVRGPRRPRAAGGGAGPGRPRHQRRDPRRQRRRHLAGGRPRLLPVLVAAGFGYHPDLVPEALATLRRERRS
jgi:hypothetical protein